MAVKVTGNDTVISSIKISRRVKIIQAFEASDTTDSDLGGSGCGISVVLGVWQVGIGHLWLDNRLHRVAFHVVHRQVGGCHAEAHGVGDVVDCLDDAIGVDVAVAAPGDTISSLHLLLDRVGVAVAVVVLTEVVLSVVLGVSGINRGCSNNYRGRGNYRSGNWGSNRSRSNSWGGVAIVGGVGQVGIADLRGNDWSSSSYWSRSNSLNWSINMVNREVGRTNAESKGIGNVVDVLDNTIRIDVAVSSTNDAISSLDLLLHRASVVVPKAVLPSVVLGVVLASLHSSRCGMDWCSCLDNRSRVDNRGRSSVGDGNNGPAWRYFHDRGGGGVVGIVLGVGQVGVLDLRGNNITSPC